MTEDEAVAGVPAMERVRQAALARAQAPPAEPVVELGHVKQAVKEFNAVVVKVPDYMHIHCSQILDALQILKRVLTDLIAHGGKSPKDENKPMSIKAAAFRKKSHELDPAFKAILLLGFKEEVVDLEKSLVYHARFTDAAQMKEYLALCLVRLETTLRDVQHHAQGSANNKEKKQTVEQRQRAAAMVQYEEDRARQKERAEREKRLRGETVAATPVAAAPVADRSRDRPMPRPPAVGMEMPLGDSPGAGAAEHAAPEGEGAEAAAPKTDDDGADEEEGGMDEDDDDDDADEEDEEEEMQGMRGRMTGSGVRRRFPGQGTRLGGAGD